MCQCLGFEIEIGFFLLITSWLVFLMVGGLANTVGRILFRDYYRRLKSLQVHELYERRDFVLIVVVSSFLTIVVTILCCKF